MSNLRQAAQQALEALDEAANVLTWDGFGKAADALRAALAEPEQDPVGWQWLNTCNYRKKLPANAIPEHWRPLYTAPTPRKPLTPDQVFAIADQHPVEGFDPEIMAFARAIERAHGIGEQHE